MADNYITNADRTAYDANGNPIVADTTTGANTEPATAHDVTEGGGIGLIGGAVVGGLAGGPVGAVIGAVVGGLASAGAVDIVDKHDNDYDRTVGTNAATTDTGYVPGTTAVDNAAYNPAAGYGTTPGTTNAAFIDDNNRPIGTTVTDDYDQTVVAGDDTARTYQVPGATTSTALNNSIDGGGESVTGADPRNRTSTGL